MDRPVSLAAEAQGEAFRPVVSTTADIKVRSTPYGGVIVRWTLLDEGEAKPVLVCECSPLAARQQPQQMRQLCCATPFLAVISTAALPWLVPPYNSTYSARALPKPARRQLRAQSWLAAVVWQVDGQRRARHRPRQPLQ